MSVNLLNDKELNNYLINLVWGDRGMPIVLDGQSQENMKDANYIEQNKDTIVRSILTQYMKHRIRAYLTASEDYPFLTTVSKRADLPDWATRALDAGQKVYLFDASKMTEKMRHDLITIRDFLYSAAESYVDKTVIAIKENKQKDKKKSPKVRLDYLKTSNEYSTFEKTLAQAEKWHEHMAELATKKVKNEKMYKKSLAGTRFIMDLPDGMKAYQLITPRALDFEGECMGNCVGQGAYDEDITDGYIEIYSIRDSDGEPHVTLEVRGQDIYQCKGKGNKAPVQRYIPAVQHFIEAQKLVVKHDMKNIGLIKQDGKYYSIYDLPNGFVVRGDLDLSDMDLSDVNLNIKVTGDLNLYNATNIKLLLKTDFCGANKIVLHDIDLSGIREIKWPTEKISLSECKNLPPVLDFSSTKEVSLDDTNLSDIREIKWPTEKIRLIKYKNLPPVLDFSSTKEVSLDDTNLSDIREIKWPSERIDLFRCKNLPPVLDFSSTKEVSLYDTNLSDIREIKWPTEEISLDECENLPPVLDFSGTKEVFLKRFDLSSIREIKWPIEYILLERCKNLPPVLDFSSTKEVSLADTNLSGIREIKWPTERIKLVGYKNLPPVLDFSSTKEVDLVFTDLSGIREIKWPTEEIGLIECKNLPPVLDFSGTKKVFLKRVDLSDIREIKWPTEEISLIECKNLPPVLDFSGIAAVSLQETDLSDIREIKWPSERIDLFRCKNLPPVLDFSGTKKADLLVKDLSGIREIKWPTEEISLSFTKNLPPKMDFSTTKKVDLKDADLSSVRKIKWPDNGQVIGLDKDMLPKHLQKSYDLWRAKTLVKNAAKKITQPNVPNRATSNEY